MAFINERLPVDVERGSQGGAGYNTTVLVLSSGKEQRNVNWSRPRARFDVSYGLVDKTDGTLAESVLAMFHNAEGRANGFRFRDWADYVIGSASAPQTIATASGSNNDFQIVRRYTTLGASSTYDRPVTRVSSDVTPQVFLNGAPQTITVDYTIDLDTGVVSFVSTPSASDVIAVYCYFDLPVRFDSDEIDLRWFYDGNFEVQSIPIIELKEALQTLS